MFLLIAQCAQTFEDVDGIGQLIVILAQLSGSLGTCAVLFQLTQLVFGKAVVVQATAQIGLGAARDASSSASSSASRSGRGCSTIMSGEMPSA